MTGDSSIVGCDGVVSVATRGTCGVGEVLVGVRGASEAYLAWSDDPIPKGVRVVVVGNRGPRTVDVVRTDDPGSGFASANPLDL